MVAAGGSTAVALLVKDKNIENIKKKIDKLKHIYQVHHNRLKFFANRLHKRPYSNHWTLHFNAFDPLDVFLRLSNPIVGINNIASARQYLHSICSVAIKNCTTVEPLVATTSHKRPRVISDNFSDIPEVFRSNHYVCNFL